MSSRIEKPASGPSKSNDSLIVSILNDLKEQQLTKNDLATFSSTFGVQLDSINSELTAHNDRFIKLEEKILDFESKVVTSDAIENRLSKFEDKMESATYDKELTKQQQLKNNISIFGIPSNENEDVKSITLKTFEAFGCNFKDDDITSVYRSSSRSTKTKSNSIIVKFNDFDKKLEALNSKTKTPVVLNDVITCESQHQNTPIFLNNHVTPFFGRLLAAGRQATKEKRIHSCWIGASGFFTIQFWKLIWIYALNICQL